MKVTVVGCSGSYPGPDSPASCYLVESKQAGRTWRILLDLGNGALGPLHRYADPLEVDGVFLSHLHADHCLDLCSYYVLRKYHPGGAPPRIPVVGPVGVAARLAAAYDLPRQPGMTGEFDFAEYAAPVEIGPFVVEPVPVVHPVPSFALRVTADGTTLAYSGDTATCAGLERAAAGADLFLAESSFVDGDDNPEGIHLTGREAAEVAARAGVRRLVLTHVPPWHDPAVSLEAARPVFDGPLELAAPGAVYEL
ncbi:MAG: MBL fold metallo-hydrolase [Nocardioidaceae bacterium]